MIALFKLSELNNIGKILPKEIMMNTTGIDNEISNEEAATSYIEKKRQQRTEQKREQRRRQRPQKSSKNEDDVNSSISSSDDAGASNSIAQVLDKRLKEHNDNQEKMFTFNWMMANGTHNQQRIVKAVMSARLKNASEEIGRAHV